MKFRRLGRVCSRIVLVSFLIWVSVSASVWAQQTSPPAATESNVSTLPAAESISQAALSSQNSGQAATSPAATVTTTPATAESSPTLHLGAGDLLEISVYNVPELSSKARVSNSGDVYLPLVDYVHVADLTLEEAQNVIERRLQDGGYVRNAHVTIFLDESASQGVTILGEVARPGIYPALGDRRLYDMISAAGGFTQSAGRKVSIVRQHDSSSTITVNLPRDLSTDLKDNIEIRPGDTITVPRAPVVYVVGEVGRPTGLLIDNGTLTVLQALALAGGTTHTAKMGGTCIIRKGPNGMTETKVPLKKMLEAKAPDVTLQADDILFVPLSGARVAAGRSFDAAISAATGLAIVAAHP